MIRSAYQPSSRSELPLDGTRLSVAGLFAGIGGIERGMRLAGHHAEMLCEIDEPATRVLRAHFPLVRLERDVREIKSLPKVDLVVAGFPCQDLSQAGRTAGIGGSRSGLVGEVFRLIGKAKPTWLLLENVSFMLSLDGGKAMDFLTTSIEALGYRWAYRVVDTQAFGLPQRRQRVLFLASRTEDPRSVIFADEAGEPAEPKVRKSSAYGFYWTEGTKGLGWAVDAVPTLKGGSTVGIPSPPAVLLSNGRIVTPEIRDAERLQGFPADWTAAAVDDPEKRNGPRWKLVGNAVSVPVAEWVGHRLRVGGSYDGQRDEAPLERGGRWPNAAWGEKGTRHRVQRSMWPAKLRTTPIQKFLQYETRPLSAKATAGFLSRAKAGHLRFQPGFIEAVQAHLDEMQRLAKVEAHSSGA